MYMMNDLLAEEVKKLFEHLKRGLFNHICISGTKETLDELYACLLQECNSRNLDALQIIFSDENTDLISETESPEIFLIKGLEFLNPKQNEAYALRSHLDVGQYQGLKSFIFCEQSAVNKHFNDYEAPFYKFCLRHRVNDTDETTKT